MPAEGRENPLLKKGNSDAFFREKYLTKNMAHQVREPINSHFRTCLFRILEKQKKDSYTLYILH